MADKPNQEEQEDSELIHWADHIALEVKERCEKDPLLKQIVKKQGYLVYDEKTPSGTIHIGSGRGWVMHDTIVKAMRNQGMDAKFILSSDDIDPYDKPNKELPKEYDKYLSMPFRNIPSPVEGYENYADHFFMQCVEKFKEFGIDAEIESTGALYEKGEFNKAIKIVLDNSDKVKAIFARLYGEDNQGAKRIPFNVICEKCGKIGTTLATHWDKEKELITYECKENLVQWTKGCGHKGEISPYNGNGKFPWKVEWAAKWFVKGVVCEYAGKDHFTEGGSRTCAIAISNEILDFPPPYPSTRTAIGKGYEFFNVGGKKMSTSKGTGVGFAQIAEIVPPKVLRYLLIKSRPHAALDFDPYKGNDLILLYERFDKTERIYFKQEQVDEKEYNQNKRVYELSHIGEIPAEMPVQISLTFAATVLQIGMGDEGAIRLLKEMGHLPEDLSGIAQHHVLERLHDARRWIDHFAPDQYKFKVRDKVPEDLQLGDKERSALKAVAKTMKQKKWTDKELHDEFYKICGETGLDTKDFFKAAYLVLIEKDKGPLLAKFVLTLGEKAIKLFEQL